MTQVLAPPGVHVWGAPRTSPAAAQLAPSIAPSAYNVNRLKSASRLSYPLLPQDKALASRPSLGMASVGSSASVAFPPRIPPSAFNIGRLPNSSVRSYPIGTPPSEEDSERVLAESAAAGIDVSAAKPARNVDPNTVLAKVKALMEGDVDANEFATLGEFANRLRIYAAMSKIRALNPTEQAAVDEIDREISAQVTALATEDAAEIEGKYNRLREADAEIAASEAAEALATRIIAYPDSIRSEISAQLGVPEILRTAKAQIDAATEAMARAEEQGIAAAEQKDLEDRRVALQNVALIARANAVQLQNNIYAAKAAEKDPQAKAALQVQYVAQGIKVDSARQAVADLNTVNGLPPQEIKDIKQVTLNRSRDAERRLKDFVDAEEKKALDDVDQRIAAATAAAVVEQQAKLAAHPVLTSIAKREAAKVVNINKRFKRRDDDLQEIKQVVAELALQANPVDPAIEAARLAEEARLVQEAKLAEEAKNAEAEAEAAKEAADAAAAIAAQTPTPETENDAKEARQVAADKELAKVAAVAAKAGVALPPLGLDPAVTELARYSISVGNKASIVDRFIQRNAVPKKSASRAPGGLSLGEIEVILNSNGVPPGVANKLVNYTLKREDLVPILVGKPTTNASVINLMKGVPPRAKVALLKRFEDDLRARNYL